MERVVILGGTGFVGRALCEQLVERHGAGGPRLVVPTRRRERGKHLFVLPTVDVIQASVNDDAALARLLQGADAVVNLIAILHGNPDEFERVHVNLPQRLAQACAKAGVKRLVHVSALGVPDDPAQAPSHYLRSKAQGEQALRTAQAAGLRLTVLRPSVIFGAHDRFLNLFARLQALAPVVPLAMADARFQPVWVDDVARAVIRCLEDPATIGQTYELAGPEVLTLAELVRLAGQASGHARPVLPVPLGVGRLQAAALRLLPGEPPLSKDNLASMSVPNVASGRLPGLAELGVVTPASVRAVAPVYLARRRRVAEQLNAFRSWAGR
ncbi:MAG TPA: complex I NDUFA9 subunit family protein [Candidatus Aquabacterium excrementipullorum]|nr:complex I NDUFA9 subunit family protein [Candidatus Aquabacterium excrementipullorum]